MNTTFATTVITLDALVLHILAIVLCIAIAFAIGVRVRAQPGSLLIMTGVSLALLRELFVLSVPLYKSLFPTILSLPKANAILLSGSLVLALVLIGIGVMRQRQIATGKELVMHRWMNVALFGAISIELGLIVNQLFSENGSYLSGAMQELAHVFALSMLALLVVLRHIHQSNSIRTAELLARQSDALVSMFSTVKHELNNDMQVVVGNAELAEIKFSSGEDVKQPLANIVRAASAAVSRIEQLSVFSSVSELSKKPIDINAVFHECSLRFSDALPSDITLRLQLESIPFKVVADAHLLTLTFTNMIQQCLLFLPAGGEIVLITRDSSKTETSADAAVIAEIVIAYESGISGSHAQHDAHRGLAEREQNMNVPLATASTLAELGGAISVSLKHCDSHATLQMRFAAETTSQLTRSSVVARARVN